MGWLVYVCILVLSSMLCIIGERWVFCIVCMFMVCKLVSREQILRGILCLVGRGLWSICVDAIEEVT